MIIYFIINKLGTIIYQSNTTSNTVATEGHRIRYLPLLVIKDLIKVNFHDTIQYIRLEGKMVVFKEVGFIKAVYVCIYTLTHFLFYFF